MKMKYDESDNAFIRASRAVTDKMTDIIGEAALGTVAALNHRNVTCILFMFERLHFYSWTLIWCLVKMFLVTYVVRQ